MTKFGLLLAISHQRHLERLLRSWAVSIRFETKQTNRQSRKTRLKEKKLEINILMYGTQIALTVNIIASWRVEIRKTEICIWKLCWNQILVFITSKLRNWKIENYINMASRAPWTGCFLYIAFWCNCWSVWHWHLAWLSTVLASSHLQHGHCSFLAASHLNRRSFLHYTRNYLHILSTRILWWEKNIQIIFKYSIL